VRDGAAALRQTMGMALRTILIAGLICGVLDGLSAVALSGGRWVRLFQYLASGLLGPRAFVGGMATVALGIAAHFSVALGAAAVFYWASRALPFMIDQALLCGVVFGILVHVFMNFVVIPLSALQKRPFNARGFGIQLLIHMIVVGPSIALTVRYYSRAKS
jgi:hypothetical protein